MKVQRQPDNNIVYFCKESCTNRRCLADIFINYGAVAPFCCIGGVWIEMRLREITLQFIVTSSYPRRR